MVRGEPHIILTIETQEPIELGAFVGAFTSLGDEYGRFIRETAPELSSEADLYVREVRAGSIVADLIPYIFMAAPFIDGMDKALIVDQFVRVWGKRFQALLGRGNAEAPATPSELKDWADAVKAIAADPDGSSKLEAAVFEDGKKKIRAAFKFNTAEARAAQREIQFRQRVIEQSEQDNKKRVLMRFTRSDIGDVNVGKPSGERVKIEEISPRALPLIYGSDIAERRIKHEIRDKDENVYKKGFVVDVHVKFAKGKPAGYAVTNLHQIIELPGDNDN